MFKGITNLKEWKTFMNQRTSSGTFTNTYLSSYNILADNCNLVGKKIVGIACSIDIYWKEE